MFFNAGNTFLKRNFITTKIAPSTTILSPTFKIVGVVLFKVYPILFIGKLKPQNNFSLLSAAEAFQRTGTSHFLHLRDQSLSFEKQQLKRMKKNSQGFSSRPFLKVNLRRGVLFAHLCFTTPMKCYCFLQYIICTERSCS